MSGEYRLILPFDSDSPEFTRGFQLGMLWEHLVLTGEVTDHLVSSRSAEMVMRIAEARGLPFTAEAMGDEWLTVSIG